ncbi:MAG: mechanosensitive ion channel family protein [Candidatus Thalassarchaeaceae archaeon]|jgi:MscS family membrane protein|nr:mechanosensitive ion channel family protein [Candidatus Thalassarchaeaceae archaeon]
MENQTSDENWMTDVVEIVPNWESEMIGFNQGTMAVLIGMIILVLIARQLSLLLMPRLFKTMCEKSPMADLAIRGSSTALGTAIGAGLLTLISVELIASDSTLMPELISIWLPSIAKVTMLVALMMWALRLTGIVQSVVEYWDDDDELDGSEKTLISAVESVLRFCIVVFGSIFIADALHFDLTTMVAGLGITGLALALAAKDSIANIFGAATVLLDRPFRVGDWIIAAGAEGEVIMISLRTTLLRTSMDTVITIPNASLTNQSIENFGKRRWRRYRPVLSLDLDSNPDAVQTFCEDVESLIQNDENTMKEDDSWAKVTGIVKDSIEVSCNIYWDVEGGADERAAKQDWLLNVARIAKKNKVEFFEPRNRNQRTLN